MESFGESFAQALALFTRFDPELWSIAGLSAGVSLSSTALAFVLTLPPAIMLGLSRIPAERAVERISQALMGIPSVAMGLFALLLLSRQGPLGFLGWLYTPAGMILAQAMLVSPLAFSLFYRLSRSSGRAADVAAQSFGAGGLFRLWLFFREFSEEIAAAGFVVFARAIAEVGTVMIVGGNIRHQTRVLTTAIAVSSSMGETGFAVALGMVLVVIALAVSVLASLLESRRTEGL